MRLPAYCARPIGALLAGWLGLAALDSSYASWAHRWIEASRTLFRLVAFAEYTELVTVVILSAFVPTLIAQQLFKPAVLDTEEEEALAEEDLSIVRRSGHRESSGQDLT
jgi:uncharacterized membrane protein YdjX (TVP38/TMEM64 family)